VNISLAKSLVLGMVLMGVVSVAICLLLWRRGRSKEKAEVESGHNPFELGDAIKFGGLFAVVIFVASAAQVYFGDTGLYVAGALAGLTDVDAIALSMANLAQQDPSRGDFQYHGQVWHDHLARRSIPAPDDDPDYRRAGVGRGWRRLPGRVARK
jgi:hypothetical protein